MKNGFGDQYNGIDAENVIEAPGSGRRFPNAGGFIIAAVALATVAYAGYYTWSAQGVRIVAVDLSPRIVQPVTPSLSTPVVEPKKPVAIPPPVTSPPPVRVNPPTEVVVVASAPPVMERVFEHPLVETLPPVQSVEQQLGALPEPTVEAARQPESKHALPPTPTVVATVEATMATLGEPELEAPVSHPVPAPSPPMPKSLSEEVSLMTHPVVPVADDFDYSGIQVSNREPRIVGPEELRSLPAGVLNKYLSLTNKQWRKWVASLGAKPEGGLAKIPAPIREVFEAQRQAYNAKWTVGTCLVQADHKDCNRTKRAELIKLADRAADYLGQNSAPLKVVAEKMGLDLTLPAPKKSASTRVTPKRSLPLPGGSSESEDYPCVTEEDASEYETPDWVAHSPVAPTPPAERPLPPSRYPDLVEDRYRHDEIDGRSRHYRSYPVTPSNRPLKVVPRSQVRRILIPSDY